MSQYRVCDLALMRYIKHSQGSAFGYSPPTATALRTILSSFFSALDKGDVLSVVGCWSVLLEVHSPGGTARLLAWLPVLYYWYQCKTMMKICI